MYTHLLKETGNWDTGSEISIKMLPTSQYKLCSFDKVHFIFSSISKILTYWLVSSNLTKPRDTYLVLVMPTSPFCEALTYFFSYCLRNCLPSHWLGKSQILFLDCLMQAESHPT